LRDEEILKAEFDNEDVVISGEKSDGSCFEERLPREDYLFEECVTCACRTPPMCDILVGDALAAETPDRFSDVEALETLDVQNRWAYFQREFDRCIRCYACRQACPMCYCEECFIDQTQPNWFGKTDEFSDTMIFHVVRAFHLAGRCVDCGACAHACPMDIDLRAMNRKLIKDAKETYGYQAGLDPDAHPLLSTFEPDDPQEFIK
jgi:ferredoxin